MIGDLRNPKTEAQTQMQRADAFWVVFDRTAHRIRYFGVLRAHYRYYHRKELASSNPRPSLLADLQHLADWAHDLRICEIENMSVLAEQARAAEMMARIWHEEQFEQPPDDFVRCPPEGDWER